MNTPIRRMHENHFKLAEAKADATRPARHWDEMFPQDEYYELTHITMPKAHLVMVRSASSAISTN